MLRMNLSNWVISDECGCRLHQMSYLCWAGTPGSGHRQPSGSGARTKPEVNLYLAQLIDQSEASIVTSDQWEGSSVVSEQSEQPRSVYNQLSNCHRRVFQEFETLIQKRHHCGSLRLQHGWRGRRWDNLISSLIKQTSYSTLKMSQCMMSWPWRQDIQNETQCNLMVAFTFGGQTQISWR